MAIELRRVNPVDAREQIVEFLWDLRTWAFETKAEYFGLWDWRVRSLSEGAPAAWIATEGGRVVGHIALLFRNLSLDAHPIRAGTLANFRVAEPYMSGPLSAALLSGPKGLMRRGEIDLLTSFSNRQAHGMAVASGLADLGQMETFFKVLDWVSFLRRRGRTGRAVAELVDVSARIGRTLGREPAGGGPSLLVTRVLQPEQMAGLDLSHWVASTDLSWSGAPAHLASRFGGSAFSHARVVGMFDRRSGRVEALAAISGREQITVLHCQVNQRATSFAAAVDAVARSTPGADSVRVPLLPNTSLARSFAARGYMKIPSRLSDPVLRRTLWSAAWRPGTEIASRLGAWQRWNLWYAWSHHV